MAEHMVFYGKGGVGKSTLIANISAALAESGRKVLQIGCDPKADSCNTLNGGLPIPTLFDRLKNYEEINLESVVKTGFKGISCIEFGDPYLLTGCASYEIARVFQILNEIDVFESIKPDFVLYDLSGEVSCARYHMQFQKHINQTAYIVTNADFMSLYAANNIFRSLNRYGESNVPIKVGGLIPNNISSSFEESLIADFAKHTNTRICGRISKSSIVRQSELYGKTVIEDAALSNQAYFYRKLARLIADKAVSTSKSSSPSPMSNEELRSWANEWGNRIYALDNGLVSDGAAI